MLRKMKLLALASLITLSPLIASAMGSGRIFLPEALSHLQHDKQLLTQHMQSLPDKHVAWDIHHVIAHRDKLSMALAVGSGIPALTYALIRLGYARITGIKNSIYKTWLAVKNVKATKNSSSGEPYYNIFKANQEEGLARFLDNIEMAYFPTLGIQNIIEKIHARGYMQRVASNIGTHYFDLMKQKFTGVKSGAIFNIVNVGKIIAYNQYGYTTPHNFAPTQLSAYQKPEPEFFQDYSNTYKGPVVFIDDSMKNVNEACKQGWIAIHFDCKKHSIKQLEQDLAILDLV